jgi:hypothetical protein
MKMKVNGKGQESQESTGINFPDIRDVLEVLYGMVLNNVNVIVKMEGMEERAGVDKEAQAEDADNGHEPEIAWAQHWLILECLVPSVNAQQSGKPF